MKENADQTPYNKFLLQHAIATNAPSSQPLYLKSREIDRQPLDARHRGEARVISLVQSVKLESSAGTTDPE